MRCWCPSSVLLICLAWTVAGCSSAVLRQVHHRLDQDDLEGAVSAAGDDRLALEAVALEILKRGMDDPETRSQAASGLRNAGFLARSTLRELVDSDDDVVSTLAAEALALQGDRSVRTLLEERLEHGDGEVRAAALRVVGIRRDDGDFFEPFLSDTDARVRLAAVQGLARLGDEAPATILCESARTDPAASVRAASIRALSRIAGSEPLLEAARVALEDPEISVRSAAIDALARLEDEASAYALLMGRMTEGEPPEAVRAAAILARRGDAEALARLRSALSEGSVALASAAALGASQLGDELRVSLLDALDRPEPEVRIHVAEALLRIDDDEELAVAMLMSLMELPGRLGLQAATAVVDRESEDVSRRLERGLAEDDPELRAMAASACGRREGGALIAREAMADEDAGVRVAAAAAVLRRLREGRSG